MFIFNRSIFTKNTPSSKIAKNKKLGLLATLLLASFAMNHSVSAADFSGQPGAELVVCTVDHAYSGLLGSQANFDAMRSKLTNDNYFGANGSVSKNTFRFKAIGSKPTEALLMSNGCNIWFSANDDRPGDEGFTALADFAANGGFVIGSCNTTNSFGDKDAVCKGMGYEVTYGGSTTPFPNSINTSSNPLACVNGELSTEDVTFTQSTINSPSFFKGNDTNPSVMLFNYQKGAYYYKDLGLIITNSLADPSMLLTGSARMWTGSSGGGVSPGSTVTSTVDNIVISAWKLAADAVTGQLPTDGSVNCAAIVPPIPKPKSVKITTDANDDGFITLSDLSDYDQNGSIDDWENPEGSVVNVRVELPEGLSEGDSVIIIDYATEDEYPTVLTTDDITRGYIDSHEINSYYDPDNNIDGIELEVGAKIKLSDGRLSDAVNDVVRYNLFTPTISVNSLAPTNNLRPEISGTTNQPDFSEVNVSTATGDSICLAEVFNFMWSCTSEKYLEEGSNHLSAITYDDFDYDKAQKAFDIIIDTTKPILQANDIGPINNNSPTLTGTTNQPNGSTVNVRNIAGNLVCSAVVGNSAWSCQANNVPNGKHVFSATTADAAGNIGEANITVTIDTIKPVINLIGDTTVEVALGSTYNDLHARVTDNLDEDLVLVGTHSVNTAVPGTYIVTYNSTDTAGNTADEVTRTVIVTEAADGIAPVITLNGDTSVTVEAGTSYTDAGASALDNKDGDLTSDIVISGSVDVNVPATYVLTYNATDAAGNKATEVTRTVIVKDTIKPVISLNGSPTVTIEAGTNYTDTGASVSDSFDTAVAVVVSGDSVDANVATTYTIKYNATDAAGNKAEEVTRTVIVKDTIKPVISLNGSPTVTVEAGTSYTDAGVSVSDSFDTTVSVTTTNPVDTASLAEYTVTYTATDASGNIADAVTRTVIVKDTIKPVITLNGNATVTLEAGKPYIDEGASVSDFDTTVTVTADNPVNTAVPEEYTVTYTATDASGNIADAVTRRVTVIKDTTPPYTGDVTVKTMPNPAKTGDEVTTVVKGIEQGATVSINGMFCNERNSDGDVTCRGVVGEEGLVEKPSIIISDAQGNQATEIESDLEINDDTPEEPPIVIGSTNAFLLGLLGVIALLRRRKTMRKG